MTADNRSRILRSGIRHGAEEVTVGEIRERAELVWRIKPNEKMSETSIRLEEFTASAARNAKGALRVIDRMRELGDVEDTDMQAALKKYVEDTCEAIKVVDNELKKHGASLEALLYEIPGVTMEDEASWRNLIGRREVIAHRLLTVDSGRVFREAVRDFGHLHELLSKICFVPVTTDIASNRWWPELAVKTEALRKLAPSRANETLRIGASLIFIYQDEQKGFLSLRLGRTDKDEMLLSSSLAPLTIPLRVSAIGGDCTNKQA